MTVFALKHAAMLIKEVAGGAISSPVIDEYPTPIQDFKVDVKYGYIDMLIGKQIEHDTIKKILASLDIKIEEETSDGLKLSVAPYRMDVQRPADVVEEILRIYGYNNVEISESIHGALSYINKPDKEKVVNTISDWLTSNGFNEMMNNSLTKSAYYEELTSFKPENLVYLLNPLSQDLNCMRQTLLFGGLETIVHNTNRKNADLRLYEFGNIYKKEPQHKGQVLPGYTEEFHLAMFVTGLKSSPNWITKEETTNFYFLKVYAENILKRMGLDPGKFQVSEVSDDIYSEAITYNINNQLVASIGILHKKILQKTDVKAPVYYADFNWNKVMNLIQPDKVTFEELPRFPEVRRDLSMVLDKEIKFDQLRMVALKTEKKLLKKINLFDVYEGDKIAQGKKSYAVSFILQDPEKTLTDQQIDKVMSNVAQSLEKELGAQIRM
jgi:phenylalanyl-tRNA synthetase beta chain